MVAGCVSARHAFRRRWASSCLAGGSELSGDWRPTVLAAGLLVVYLVVIALAPLRAFFSLAALNPVDYLLIGAAALIWNMILYPLIDGVFPCQYDLDRAFTSRCPTSAEVGRV